MEACTEKNKHDIFTNKLYGGDKGKSSVEVIVQEKRRLRQLLINNVFSMLIVYKKKETPTHKL